MRIARVVLSGKYAAHALVAWTTCCSNQQSPNKAKSRDGSFDRWDVDQVISTGWQMHHVTRRCCLAQPDTEAAVQERRRAIETLCAVESRAPVCSVSRGAQRC